MAVECSHSNKTRDLSALEIYPDPRDFSGNLLGWISQYLLCFDGARIHATWGRRLQPDIYKCSVESTTSNVRKEGRAGLCSLTAPGRRDHVLHQPNKPHWGHLHHCQTLQTLLLSTTKDHKNRRSISIGHKLLLVKTTALQSKDSIFVSIALAMLF